MSALADARQGIHQGLQSQTTHPTTATEVRARRWESQQEVSLLTKKDKCRDPPQPGQTTLATHDNQTELPKALQQKCRLQPDGGPRTCCRTAELDMRKELGPPTRRRGSGPSQGWELQPPARRRGRGRRHGEGVAAASIKKWASAGRTPRGAG